MGHYEYNETDIGKTLYYYLDTEEEIDQIVLGMLLNNTIKGAVPIYYVQNGENRIFSYNLTGLVPFEELTKGDVSFKSIVSSMINMLSFEHRLRDYLISEMEVDWNEKLLYVSETTGEHYLVLVPVKPTVSFKRLKDMILDLLSLADCRSPFECQSADEIKRLLHSDNSDNTMIEKVLSMLNGIDLDIRTGKISKPSGTAQENQKQTFSDENQSPFSAPVILSHTKASSAASEQFEIADNKAGRESRVSEYLENENLGENKAVVSEDGSKIREASIPYDNTVVISKSSDVGRLTQNKPGIVVLDRKEGIRNESSSKARGQIHADVRAYQGYIATVYLKRNRNGEEILIDKDLYKIGGAGDVDYNLSGNPLAQSTKMCLSKQNGKTYVYVLGEGLPAFINERMIQSGQMYEVRTGDVLTFAKETFVLSIR